MAILSREVTIEVIKLCVVGVLSAYTTIRTLERDLSALTTQVAMVNVAQASTETKLDKHMVDNAAMHLQIHNMREVEDRKWDARITRLENCFISRQCGVR